MENLVNTAVSEYGRLDVMVCDGQQCRHLHRPAHHRRRKPKTKTTAPCSSTSRAYGWAASSRSGRCCPRTRSTGHGDASSTSPRSEAWSARGRARLLRRQRRRGEPDPPACRRLRRRTHQRQRLIPVLGLCPVAVPVVRGPRCRRRRPKLPLQPSPTASGAWSPQWAATNDEPPRTASTRPLGVNPGLPIREFPNDFAAGGAPRHRNCNVNLDDLDWDRPDLDCKASKRWASLAIFAWTRQCERNVLFGWRLRSSGLVCGGSGGVDGDDVLSASRVGVSTKVTPPSTVPGGRVRAVAMTVMSKAWRTR